jgi:hypothetical protein
MEQDIKVGDWVVINANYLDGYRIEKGIVVKIWDNEGMLDSYICVVPEKGKPYVLRYYLSSLNKIMS